MRAVFVGVGLSLIAGTAMAGDCGVPVVRAQVALGASGFVAVPFAVPVAVPVATLQTPAVLYSWRAYAGVEEVRPQVATRAAEAAPFDAQGGTGLVQQKCTRCHEGAEAKGSLDLSDMTALSAAQRLDAVRRVVSDDAQVRMPRGMTLSPSEVGRIVQELSAAVP